MTIKIIIDKNTIKENPNVGSTKTVEIVLGEYEIKIGNLSEDEANIIKNRYENLIVKMVRSLGQYSFKIITTENISEEIINLVKTFTNPEFLLDRKIYRKDFHHIPETGYFYDYLPTQVACSECNSIFSHDKLTCDCFDDDFSDEVCPVCGAWNCCDIEYQSIDEAIKEAGKFLEGIK